MNLLECVKVAIEGLAANKLRSALTMLGVVIGVGAVIAMLAIAHGARKEVMDRIHLMGTNVLTVMAGQQRRGMIMGGMGTAQNLTYDDAVAISERCPAVAKVTAEVRSSGQVKYKNMNTMTTILGVTPDYFDIRNFPIEEGRALVDRDLRSLRRVGVIGATAAFNLFGNDSPLNETIRINGINFQIVGITREKGATGWMDPDDQIIIPLTTAQRRLLGIDYVRAITVQATGMDDMRLAEEQIARVMDQRTRPIGGEPGYRIRSQAEWMETAEETSRTFTLLLSGIAAVSLLVGGIGIMNIMLVSVTERTREIGIRKAVGARRKDILLQFLIESMVLSLLGGFVGILLGVGGARILAKTADWEVIVSLPAILLAFGFAAAVGIFFGIYPARKASLLRPIDALRYE